MVERLYESYRSDGKPDAPAVPFHKLNDTAQEKWLSNLKTVSRIVSVDSIEVGYITIINRNKQINLGFGIFPEFRNQGYMTKIVPEAISLIKSKFPNTEIFSSVEQTNEPAKRILIKSGFKFFGEETKFNAIYNKYQYKLK